MKNYKLTEYTNRNQLERFRTPSVVLSNLFSILSSSDYNLADRHIIDRVAYWSMTGRPCFETNKSLALYIGIGERTVKRIVSKLSEEGVIHKTTVATSQGRQRWLWVDEDFLVKWYLTWAEDEGKRDKEMDREAGVIELRQSLFNHQLEPMEPRDKVALGSEKRPMEPMEPRDKVALGSESGGQNGQGGGHIDTPGGGHIDTPRGHFVPHSIEVTKEKSKEKSKEPPISPQEEIEGVEEFEIFDGEEELFNAMDKAQGYTTGKRPQPEKPEDRLPKQDLIDARNAEKYGASTLDELPMGERIMILKEFHSGQFHIGALDDLLFLFSAELSAQLWLNFRQLSMIEKDEIRKDAPYRVLHHLHESRKRYLPSLVNYLDKRKKKWKEQVRPYDIPKKYTGEQDQLFNLTLQKEFPDIWKGYIDEQALIDFMFVPQMYEPGKGSE